MKTRVLWRLKMTAYKCPVCDYKYDEEIGDLREGYPPGTKWEDVQDNWTCPDCGVREKVDFVQD